MDTSTDLSEAEEDAADIDPMEQHRASQRRRQLKSGKLIFNDEASVIDCVVRDISDHGAGIKCDTASHVPKDVVLKMANGDMYDAEVVWQTPNQLGLRFKTNQEMPRLVSVVVRRQDELRGSMREIMDIADAYRRGDYGALSHPRLRRYLDKISDKGGEFLAAIDEMLGEFGPGTNSKVNIPPPPRGG